MSSHAMPLFEITNAQLSFRYSLSVPMPYHAKWCCKFKHDIFHYHNNSNCNYNSNVIKAVAATFEPKTLAAKAKIGDSNQLDLALIPQPLLQSSEEDEDNNNSDSRNKKKKKIITNEEIDEREKLRRMRISKANSGNTPWNKGRKHSPETLQKIRERTKLAMQDPKIKMKLVNLGHAQTAETRMKIGVGVKLRWAKRRGKKMEQESCCIEWQNLIAEASRQGYVGQEELHWNSYKALNEQLKEEWLESVKQRKQIIRTPDARRAPKSPEQRRKIAEAIAAKWADPEYRSRVCSALAKYHGTEAGAERKPRRRPNDGEQPTKKRPITKSTGTSMHVKGNSRIRVLKKRITPAYKDPLVNSKLKMIRNIRAQRAAAETKETEAIERARALIAEAEKAAKALEVAATKSPIAQLSLMETRKLIAEAIQSLESIDTQGIADSNVPSLGLSEVDKEEGSAFEVLNQSQIAQVNGHATLSSSDYKFSEEFGKISLEKTVNGDPELHLTNGYASLPFTLNSQIKKSIPSNQQRETEQSQSNDYKTDSSPTVMRTQSLEDETISRSPIVTKKWVCGRLIEVAEDK